MSACVRRTLQSLVFVALASAGATAARAQQRAPGPSPDAVQVPEGFVAEVVLRDLTYPTSVEFDDGGTMYVAEAGYSYGDDQAQPRILRVSPKGELSVAISGGGLRGPITDLLWHGGKLYVAHRGKVSLLESGRLRDVVTGLPSDGDHHNNQLAAGPDGKIYFGQGTATNSGVVGPDNFDMGWLKEKPSFHDVPAGAMRLRSRAFTSRNPLTKQEDQVRTAAFQPFGQILPDDRALKGETKASGTVLRMNPDGSGLEVHAWGLRNPFGLVFAPDGTLYVSENGFDVRGSRPIANDTDDLYVVKAGASAKDGGGGQKEESLTPGPRRLMDVVFSRAGDALYVVDFGAMVVDEHAQPYPQTGLVWRVRPSDTRVPGPKDLSAKPLGTSDRGNKQ